jgi:hypothetical protein
MNGLQKIIDRKIPLALKYLVTKTTYQDMENYIQSYFRQFPDTVSLQICFPDYCGTASEESELIKVSFSEWRTYLESALDHVIVREKEGKKRTIWISDTPLCAVDAYYWKYLLQQTPTILTVYNSPKERKPRYDVPSESGVHFIPCQKCSVRSVCPGTWQSVGQLFGNSAFIPVL